MTSFRRIEFLRPGDGKRWADQRSDERLTAGVPCSGVIPLQGTPAPHTDLSVELVGQLNESSSGSPPKSKRPGTVGEGSNQYCSTSVRNTGRDS